MAEDCTREQARDTYDLYYRGLSQRLAKAVTSFYEDMASQCDARARKSHDQDDTTASVMSKVLKSVAFSDTSVAARFVLTHLAEASNAQARDTIQRAFREHVKKEFEDFAEAYRRLFIAKSRLLASPLTSTKFKVQSSDNFLNSAVIETSKIALGEVDVYDDPGSYESNMATIGTKYYRKIKSLLDSQMPTFSAVTAAAETPPLSETPATAAPMSVPIPTIPPAPAKPFSLSEDDSLFSL